MVGAYVTVRDITRRIYIPQRDAVSERFIEESDDVGTAHILSMQTMVNRNKGVPISSDTIKKMSNEEVEGLFSDKHLAMSAQCDHEVIEVLNEQIDKIEKAVFKEVKLKKPYKKLLTVPGIGKILAMTIMLETGDIGRFCEVGKYSSYSRCVSAKKVSNGKNKGKGNRKNGNKYLAWAYVEAAHFHVRYCEEARKWYQKKASGSNAILAMKALSNKLARACYYINKGAGTLRQEKNVWIANR